MLVVGAGHSGLGLAAHVAQLDVSTLVIDKNPRVGDNVCIFLNLSFLLLRTPLVEKKI